MFTMLHSQQADGYKLWLKYDKIENSELLNEYAEIVSSIYFKDDSDILKNAKKEFSLALPQILNKQVKYSNNISSDNSLIVNVYENLPNDLKDLVGEDIEVLTDEGFIIKSFTYKKKSITIISAKKNIGILYATFRFLHLMQTHKKLKPIDLVDSPKIDLRMLNHWDNLDRSVERGYAGF